MFLIAGLIDNKKLENKFDIGKCYPIFDPKFTWKKAFKETKLALCIGYSDAEEILEQLIAPKEQRDREKKTKNLRLEIQQKISKILPEFTLYASGKESRGGCLIFANKNFMNVFPKE